MGRIKLSKFHIRMTGFSVVELLVVVAIFAILAVLATQSIATSLRGAKKSSNAITLRQNLDYVNSVMSRQLRNASGVAQNPCGHSPPTTSQLTYTDENGQTQTFACSLDGLGHGRIDSSAIGRLTPPEVNITSCATAFTCSVSLPGGEPPTVTVSLTGTNTNATGADLTTVSTTARIILRTYSVY